MRGCVCGSDLWYHRGVNSHRVGSIGHEYVGVVEAVGADVHNLVVGDFVIAPFTYNDGTCPACRAGFESNCEHGGAFGDGESDGGQGEKVRAALPRHSSSHIWVFRHPVVDVTSASIAGQFTTA